MGDEKKLYALTLAADPARRVPKYCTSILFSKLKNGQIILTLIENDGPKDSVQEDQGVLIERILIDSDHAERMVTALKDMLEAKEN
jgi:hypothetical protein